MADKLMSAKELLDSIKNYIQKGELDKVDCEFSVVPFVDASIDKNLLNMEAIQEKLINEVAQGYAIQCLWSDISQGDDVILTLGAYGYSLSLVRQILTDDDNEDYDELYKELSFSLLHAFERDNEDRDLESILLCVTYFSEEK